MTTGGRYSSLLAEYLAAHLGQLRPQVAAVRGDERAVDSLVPALAVVEALIAAAVRELGDAPRARIAAYDAYWAQRHGIGAVPPQASRNPKDPLPVRNPAS